MEAQRFHVAAAGEGMRSHPIWPLIRKHPVFDGIPDDHLSELMNYFRELHLKPGQYLIEEGSASQDLYLILEGQLEVIKAVKANGEKFSLEDRQEFIVARLVAGEAIGELSFVRREPRSATVRCNIQASLLSLSPEELELLENERPRATTVFMRNLLGYVGTRLRRTSENEVKALRQELQSSMLTSKANLFFSYIIGLLCLYNLAIHQITTLSLDPGRASIISALIIFVFGSGLVLMINQSRLPAQMFGVTIRNWKPALKESMIWTVGIIGVLILLKWLLITNIARYHETPLFNFDLQNQRHLAFNFVLYGLHSPIQEFIARGVLQGSLQHFFKGRNVTGRAIVISNALFSATHVHLLGGLLGVIVFVPGLFWGWLYSRHQNLIGVSISHILIGWTGLFFLDLESLF